MNLKWLLEPTDLEINILWYLLILPLRRILRGRDENDNG